MNKWEETGQNSPNHENILNLAAQSVHFCIWLSD